MYSFKFSIKYMKLTFEQQDKLLKMMKLSAQKGNLANSAIVLEDGKIIASAESWVVSSYDATAHSERMLVSTVCNLKHSNYTPGLTMISVVEPCLMCISACSQAGYKKIGFIIPAQKYIKRIPWMSDTEHVDKADIALNMVNSVELIHLNKYEEFFCEEFEKYMKLS